MWNGDLALGQRILTPSFRIHFGGRDDTDSLRGPADLTGFISSFRSGYRSLRYRTDIGPIFDGAHVACRWLADLTDDARGSVTTGGIDLLRLEGDRIAEAWSVSGSRILSS